MADALDRFAELGSDGLFVLSSFILIGLFLYDIFVLGLARNATTMSILFSLYGFVGGLMFPRLQRVYDNKTALRKIFGYTAVAVFLPYALQLFANVLVNRIGTGFLGTVALELFGYINPDAGRLPWFAVAVLYFASWPNFLVNALRQSNSGALKLIFQIINALAWGAILFHLMWVVFAVFAVTPIAAMETPQYEPPTGQDVIDLFFGRPIDAARGIIDQRRNDTQDFLNRTLPERYTGTVERQQGAELGVRVAELRSVLPYYTYEVTGQAPNLSVTPLDRSIEWQGVIRARTLASDIDLSLNCVYVRPTSSGNDTPILGSARPPRLTIRSSGDFMEQFSFDCAIPLAAIPYTEQNFQSGAFEVRTNFSFETWGFTTLHFMDHEQVRSLRASGQEPSSYLGIRPLSQAVYTPGPVRLGMPQVSLPISVHIRDEFPAVIPPMGVTLENAWEGLGAVRNVSHVIMQIPLPFELVTGDDQCSGTTEQPIVLAPETPVPFEFAAQGQEVVTPGYRWYIFTDIPVPVRGAFTTVRCPMRIDSELSEFLLNPDLSSRQFTFVTQVRYEYETRQRAPIQIRLVRRE